MTQLPNYSIPVRLPCRSVEWIRHQALAVCLLIPNALIADYSSPRPDICLRERCGCDRCIIFSPETCVLTLCHPALHQCADDEVFDTRVIP